MHLPFLSVQTTRTGYRERLAAQHSSAFTYQISAAYNCRTVVQAKVSLAIMHADRPGTRMNPASRDDGHAAAVNYIIPP